jgi:YgiT-type zinc finger domain-containing protein
MTTSQGDEGRGEEIGKMECPLCQGDLKPGGVTYTANRYGYHLLLDDVPDWICQRCGEPIFEDRVVEAIQHLLMRLDESIERVCPGAGLNLGKGLDNNMGGACMDTSREVMGRGEEEEAMDPERAAKCLEDWATKHSKALTGISAVEAIREARESR